MEKSHTCEEGGAHLRISFWHLLMNFEKPEKSEFWKNEKKLLEISSFYRGAPKNTIIWGTVPEIRSETIFFVLLGHFLPFKNIKNTWRYYPFTHVHHKSKSYDVWFLRYKVQRTFLLFQAIFSLWPS